MLEHTPKIVAKGIYGGSDKEIHPFNVVTLVYTSSLLSKDVKVKAHWPGRKLTFTLAGLFYHMPRFYHKRSSV